jgi:hypothetical protein
VRVFQAILSVLKNAFIEALKPSIDYSINITNVEPPKKEKKLRKLFGKKEE